MGIDILGIDVLGIDILGIDIVAPTQCGHIDFFINNGLDEMPNDAYNWPGATLFWISTLYFN